MDFIGPEPADLVDVRSINIAFLEHLAGAEGEALRREFPARLRPVVAALTERQVFRLAGVPFLLMTLNESDDSYWNRMRDELPIHDLFAASHSPVDSLGQIVVAALGFQWQLARKNLYAARLVSGASLNWCEQLASCTLLRVLQCAVEHQGLIAPRQAKHKIFWTRLLGAGLSSNEALRRAAHLSALQIVLSPINATPGRRWRSAARYAPVPMLETHSRRSVREDN
jgi:hypothetical protein